MVLQASAIFWNGTVGTASFRIISQIVILYVFLLRICDICMIPLFAHSVNTIFVLFENFILYVFFACISATSMLY